MRRQRSRHRATSDERRVVSGIRRPANRPGRRATGSTTRRARGSAILTRRRRSWAASDGGHRRVRPPSARRGWTLRQSMNVVTFLPPAKATHLGGSRVSRPVRRRHRSKRQQRALSGHRGDPPRSSDGDPAGSVGGSIPVGRAMTPVLFALLHDGRAYLSAVFLRPSSIGPQLSLAIVSASAWVALLSWVRVRMFLPSFSASSHVTAW